MATRWIDHVLGPAVESDRPDPTAAPVGALFQNTDTGDLEINTGSAWITYRAAVSSGLADPTTTKGDLLVRGSSSVGRLAVGSDGYVLTADSSQASGVKWAAASGGGGGSTLVLAAGASVPGGTPADTLVFRKATYSSLLTAEGAAVILELDETTGNFLDTSGNSRDFTPGTGVSRGVTTGGFPDGGNGASTNGSSYIGNLGSAGGMSTSGTVICWLYMLGSTNQFNQVIDVGVPGGNGWAFAIGNGSSGAGRQLMGVSNGVGYISGPYSLPPIDAMWCLAMTLQGTGWSWFVNGSPVGGNLSGTGSNGSPGGLRVGHALPTTAIMRRAAYFPTVLSPQKIKQISGLPPYGPIGVWDGSALQPLASV